MIENVSNKTKLNISNKHLCLCIHHYTNLTCVRSYVRACVRESGRSREAIRPVLQNFLFSGSLELDVTQKSPLTQPAMASASNGISPGLKETLCNSAGQKID